MPEDRRNIYLVGPMGSGKTAVGRQLARELNCSFIDTDAEIEKRAGVDIRYIFDKEGEAGFRDREKAIVEWVAGLEGYVVATGGGVVLFDENRQHLKRSGTIIYLATSVDTQLRRTSRSRNRPLLASTDRRAVLEQLMAIRNPLYEAVADIRLDTSGRHIQAIVGTACRQLAKYKRCPPP